MSKCDKRTQENFKITDFKYRDIVRVGEKVDFGIYIKNTSLIFGDTVEVCLSINNIEVFKKREHVSARATIEYFTSVDMNFEGVYDVHLSVKDVNFIWDKECEDFKSGSLKVLPVKPTLPQLGEEFVSELVYDVGVTSAVIIFTAILFFVSVIFFMG